ncbi:MAG: sigma-70 family RNA polymerase sigma factor [Phycisphaera sp.]|nr:sigma-70 family RNA polymerase sigma factor [Phycisphaera sp.]
MSGKQDKQFVQLLLRNQRRIYGFVLTLVGNPHDADDVYQEACIKLWELADLYDPTRDFVPWACGVAFNVVRNHRHKIRRDRHVFSDAFLSDVADAHENEGEWMEERRLALIDCMEKLPADHRKAVDLCYNGRMTIQQVADMLDKPREGFYKQLQRIRRSLFECVTDTLAAEGGA